MQGADFAKLHLPNLRDFAGMRFVLVWVLFSKKNQFSVFLFLFVFPRCLDYGEVLIYSARGSSHPLQENWLSTWCLPDTRSFLYLSVLILHSSTLTLLLYCFIVSVFEATWQVLLSIVLSPFQTATQVSIFKVRYKLPDTASLEVPLTEIMFSLL